MEAASIIPPAFFKKCFPLFQTYIARFLKVGILYLGSSITRGNFLPLKNNLFTTMAEPMVRRTLRIYREKITKAEFLGKKILARSM